MMRREDGYTLVELIIAMAIFGFMLAIIVAGFVNIMRLHNSAVSMNVVMDNAQTILSTLEREVRDGTAIDTPALAASELCIDNNQLIYVDASFKLQTVNAVNCVPTGVPTQLSSDDVKIYDFELSNYTPASTRPTVHIAMTIGSANATVTGVGAATVCAGNVSDRAWCSITSITGAATPRGTDGGTP